MAQSVRTCRRDCHDDNEENAKSGRMSASAGISTPFSPQHNNTPLFTTTISHIEQQQMRCFKRRSMASIEQAQHIWHLIKVSRADQTERRQRIWEILRYCCSETSRPQQEFARVGGCAMIQCIWGTNLEDKPGTDHTQCHALRTGDRGDSYYPLV